MSRTTRGRSARRWSFSIIGGKASQLSQILKNFILKNYWRGNLEGNLKQEKDWKCAKYRKPKTFDPFWIYTVSTKKLDSLFFGNISASTRPNSKSKVSFKICLFWGFQNCHYFWYLAELKLRYLRLKTPGVIFSFHVLCNFKAFF